MLVKVWHPDRFEGDRKLSKAAGEKLKGINAAFKLLSSSPRPVGGRKHPTPEPKESTKKAQSTSEHTRPFAERDVNRPTGNPTASPPPNSRPSSDDSPNVSVPQESSGWSRLLRYVIIFGGISLAKYFWPAGGTVPNTNAVVHPTYEVDSTFSPRSTSLFDHFATSEQAKPTSHTAKKAPPYFTVGSTREEVLAVQGTPTSFSQDTLEYGASEVYLSDGKVVSWKNWKELNPLRVKLVPKYPTSTTLGYFTVGSTKDEVLAVQGTPTAFSDDTFEYGASEVYFKDDKVVNWKEWRELNPLRVKLH
jgi:curved DNA-binding protein CbpA